MTTSYDIIIVGGGPVGLALSIELGMLGVKTIVIEKHHSPQLLPRAQLLNPRSMEFFRRWGINQALVSRKLLSDDYPLRSTWCAGLKGEVYCSVDFNETINQDLSPENYQRIPLWITEDVLRKRVADFASISWIDNSEVINIKQHDTHVVATLKKRDSDQIIPITGQYLIGCDGAHSITRQMAGISMQNELPALRMLSVMFSSTSLNEAMTVPKSILYYNLTLAKPAALGCIDDKNGLWYAQIACPGDETINEINIANLLDQVAGFCIYKTNQTSQLLVTASATGYSLSSTTHFFSG